MSDLGLLENLLDGVGVEWVPLGDLEDSGLLKLGRGSVISKNDLANTPGEFPVYSSSASDRGEFGRYGKFMFDDERLTWSIDGGGRFFYRSPHKYSVTNVCGWLSVLECDKLSTRYLYHYLSAAWANKVFDYTKKAHPSVIRKEYSIPIPFPDDPEKSLAIQGEIVRILDSFTELTAELTAELAARKKQYNHYRDQLLTFEDGEVEWKPLGEICEIGDGNHSSKYPKSSEMVSQGIPFIRGTNFINGKVAFEGMKFISEQKHKELKKGHLKPNDVLITNRGEVGKVAFVPEHLKDANLNSQLAWLRADSSKLSSRYLFHALSSAPIQNSISGEGGALQQLTIKNIKLIRIPVPSPDEQARIVAILDTFDTLTTSLSEGLPREIALRQQQYEYYRDLLLSFPKPAEAFEGAA